MKTRESEGFFCVVYFTDTKKTAYYHKSWKPASLARKLNNWLWMKIYIDKQDYYSNTKANNYYKIFDKDNPVEDFTFKPFSKNRS